MVDPSTEGLFVFAWPYSIQRIYIYIYIYIYLYIYIIIIIIIDYFEGTREYVIYLLQA